MIRIACVLALIALAALGVLMVRLDGTTAIITNSGGARVEG